MWTPGICMMEVVPGIAIPLSMSSERHLKTAIGPMSRVFSDGLLQGRVALVTGGGSGLGKAAAVELAACGARVVVAGRREAVLDAAVEEIGHGASHVAGDVREAADAQRLVRTCLDRHGSLDVLVN